MRENVGHAEHSDDMRRFIAEGKKVIVSAVQKFPFILDEIGAEHRGRKFAIVIDAAHSSQGGRTSAAVSMALSAPGLRLPRRHEKSRVTEPSGRAIVI